MDIQTELSKSQKAALKPSQSFGDLAIRLIAMGELLKPGPTLDSPSKVVQARLWMKTIAEIGPERFQRAFEEVLSASTFRPDISEIRKAAGVNNGIIDPTRKEAVVELTALVDTLRVHGRDRRPLLGKVTDEQDAEGRVLTSPKREPATEAPPLSERARTCLAAIGMGDVRKGEHILHAVFVEADEFGTFSMRLREKLENQWCQVWSGKA